MNRIKELRTINKIKQNDLASQLKVSQGTLSGWENGKYEPDLKSINKMCDIFHVTTDFLLGRAQWVICPICHHSYDPRNEFDSKAHEEFHKQFEEAQEKYGQILVWGEAVRLKDESIMKFRNSTLSIEERMSAYDNYLKYKFMIDLWDEKLSLNHDSFDTFAKIETTTLYPDEIISEELCNKIYAKYGVDPEEKNIQLNARDERDIKKNLDSIMSRLSNQEFGPAAYDGQELSPEAAELFRDELEIALRRLKLINKEKYNPHKNKK